MNTRLPKDPQFNKFYLTHCKYLKLKGLQPKTIEAYSRAIRRIGNYFDARVDTLTMDELLDYFHDLLESHSCQSERSLSFQLRFLCVFCVCVCVCVGCIFLPSFLQVLPNLV